LFKALVKSIFTTATRLNVMRKSYLLLALIFVGCSSAYKINEVETARILETLSADDMAGRRVNTPGVEKAANFIANEFKSIGLGTLQSEESFMQAFKVFSKSLGSAKVVLNNMDVPPTSYFMRMSTPSITWTDSNFPEIVFISEEEDFRSSIRQAFASAGDLLVVVSTAHKSMFNMYRSHYSKPNLSYENNKSDRPNVVVVLGDNAQFENLFIDAAMDVEEVLLNNVVGVIEGKKTDEMVLFSAHYDHLGVGEAYEGDSIYNGANDDASGVAAVIELARFFKTREAPERTLIFAAFTGEEVGVFGSKYFSNQMEPDKIIAMLNIEMIGKPSKNGLNSAWMTGWERSDLGEILQNNLSEVDFDFFPDPYPEENLFYRSDNASLARLGVPAHSISTTQMDIDEDYHQLSDEVETLDITNITNTIKAIALGAQGIIDGTQTPTRINSEEVNN
jgi:hypothetical protein